jgi:C1A family cysteine protease
MDLNRLRSDLSTAGAHWEPREIAGKFYLGYRPGPPNRPLQEREAAAVQMVTAMPAAPVPAIDWRHYPGKPPLPAGDYVTPIRDQKTCGSCVSFGTVAAFESALRIHAKDPKKAVDLSEADLFYCHGGAPSTPTCETGWYPEAALTSCQKAGVVDEKCFPYTPGDQPCKKCEDWEKRVIKIKAWKKFMTAAEIKHSLATHGPLVTCMTVYEDFFHYHTGIYHHVSGSLQGGHCICCVGYDDRKRFWICKNSWNTTWGDQGYFKIAYGQCGIDASMWMLEG